MPTEQQIAEYVRDYYSNNGRRRTIEEVVRLFVRYYPSAVLEAREKRDFHRRTQANRFGSDSEKELRFGLVIPGKLDRLMGALLPKEEPRFLETVEETHWFMRKFPEFRVAEKV